MRNVLLGQIIHSYPWRNLCKPRTWGVCNLRMPFRIWKSLIHSGKRSRLNNVGKESWKTIFV